MTSQYISQFFQAEADLNRMGAQVISGVGFLGVGTIIVTGRNQVRGLTTAAGLWTCACIGLAAGVGYIEGVLLCLVFVMFTFKVLNQLDHVLHNHAKIFDVYLEFDSNKSVDRFIGVMRKENIKLSMFEVSKNNIKGGGPTALATIEVEDRSKRPVIMEMLQSIEGLKFMEEL